MGKSKKSKKLLTEVELEVMSVIWKLGKCTVRDVVDSLQKERKIAYTSVATIMKILEDKGVLRSEKKEKTHTYEALRSRDQYEGTTLKHLAEKLFEGSPSSMVMRLLNEAELTKEELQAIRKSLDERIRS